MPNFRKIYFRMFGNFDILVNKKSVLSKGFRQQGFNKLFIFFMLNHDRVFEINTLIEKVWPNKEYHDNNSIMRTQIFRLKRQLSELVPSLEFKLEFTHGGYCFSYDPKNVIIDTDIFENLCAKIFSSKQASLPNTSGAGADYLQSADQDARALASPFRVHASVQPSASRLTSPAIGAYTPGRIDRISSRASGQIPSGVQYSDSEILRLCSDALRIYQSGFLNETAFDLSWLESYKQNYRRMWFRIIETFTDLCYRSQNFSEIISLCQEVLRFDDSEEYIHEIYMDALRKAGYHQDALKHYEIITSLPAKKDVFLNSSRLRDLHRSILRETENTKLIDEDDLEQYILELTGETGTVVSDKEVFLRHCSMLRLHSERSNYQPYICIIETIGYATDDPVFRRLSDVSYVTNVVKNVFRKSDVLCEWNSKQVLVLMASKQDFNADILASRIKMEILRDNLSPEDEDNENLNLAERVSYLPLNIKIIPIGESRELNEYQREVDKVSP